MLRRSLAILLLHSGAAVSLACSCVWFETQEALQDLFDGSDVVLTGYAVRSLTPHLDQHLNKKFMGYNVLFKVTRVYKGRLRADSVFVLQNNNSCAHRFTPQDTVLVFGTAIRAVRRAPRRDTSPYDPGTKRKIHVYYTTRRSQHLELLLRLHARYFTFSTSQCVCFDPHNKLIADFIRAKTQARP